MFHVARDRKLILPFIAFIAVGIIFTFFSLAFNVNGGIYK
jgi:fucose 4-O-acetylase-like acetyltransferase